MHYVTSNSTSKSLNTDDCSLTISEKSKFNESHSGYEKGEKTKNNALPVNNVKATSTSSLNKLESCLNFNQKLRQSESTLSEPIIKENSSNQKSNLAALNIPGLMGMMDKYTTNYTMENFLEKNNNSLLLNEITKNINNNNDFQDMFNKFIECESFEKAIEKNPSKFLNKQKELRNRIRNNKNRPQIHFNNKEFENEIKNRKNKMRPEKMFGNEYSINDTINFYNNPYRNFYSKMFAENKDSNLVNPQTKSKEELEQSKDNNNLKILKQLLIRREMQRNSLLEENKVNKFLLKKRLKFGEKFYKFGNDYNSQERTHFQPCLIDKAAKSKLLEETPFEFRARIKSPMVDVMYNDQLLNATSDYIVKSCQVYQNLNSMDQFVNFLSSQMKMLNNLDRFRGKGFEDDYSKLDVNINYKNSSGNTIIDKSFSNNCLQVKPESDELVYPTNKSPVPFIIEKVEKQKMESSSHKVKFFHKRQDCLNKRIKTHLHKYVFNKINEILNCETEEKQIIFKLPKDFISELSIHHNKLLFNKSIEEVYSLKLPNQYAENSKHNKLVFETTDTLLFRSFVSKTFREIYIEYLNSTDFIKDFNNIRIKEGKEYASLFKKSAYVLFHYIENGNAKRNSQNINFNIHKIELNLDYRNNFNMMNKDLLAKEQNISVFSSCHYPSINKDETFKLDLLSNEISNSTDNDDLSCESKMEESLII